MIDFGITAFVVAVMALNIGIIMQRESDGRARVRQAETEIRQAWSSGEAINSLRSAPSNYHMQDHEYETLIRRVREFAQETQATNMMAQIEELLTRVKANDATLDQDLATIFTNKVTHLTPEGMEPSAENLSAHNTDKLNNEVNELLRKWMTILKASPHLMQLDQIPLTKFLEIREYQIQRIEADSSINNKQEAIQKVEVEILQCIESWNAFKKFSQENERKRVLLASGDKSIKKD